MLENVKTVTYLHRFHNGVGYSNNVHCIHQYHIGTQSVKADLNRRSESHSQDQLVFHMTVTHLASSTKYKVDASDQISSLPI